ncbi:MAG: RagB/SusD family nutrient uptake outer membrane protein [Paludibacteraceae bacterium]|nr:RagB/SusD family nutrient uptake outer membrane protein [Paludibacteraceae bacterium]
MKTYLKYAAAATLMLALTGCVQNLNTEPIDPNIVQTFQQDEVYYKIYAGLGTSGQKGPDGDCDIVANNEGYSVFYRLVFVHNEFPADGGWWIWGDAGVPDLLECKWTSENAFVSLLYNRLNFNVTTCNHFLENTEGMTDEKTVRQRAEIRFMRALNFYYLMDFFGNPPFSLAVTSKNPTQIEGGRPALYQWLVDELLAAENDLEEKTSTYRVSKDAARVLLARLYLNAEVYTDGAVKAYDKAEEYAKKVMDKYELADKYAELFMGDNDTNGAAKEIIFAIPQDGNMVQSWGGSSCMVAMTRSNGSMDDYGSDAAWECWRSSPSLVSVFTDSPDSHHANEFNMPAEVGDDRALLSNVRYVMSSGDNPVRLKDANGNDSVNYNAVECTGPAAYGTGNFTKCWSICKWTGIYSTGTSGKHVKFVDTDVPFIRAAEAYMTYAEALYRQGNPTEALNIINTKIRARAHAAALPSIDDDVLLDEWQREFYAEARRRIDLIRFGQFAGPKATRTWEGHKAGIDKKYNLYALPNSDCVANPNLKQNEGF